MATHNEHLDSDFHDDRSPWAKPSVMLSGMFLLALLLAGIVFLVVKGGGSSTRTHHAQSAHGGSPAPATTPARTATTTAAGAGGCSLPAGSQTVPSASPPAGTQWAQVGSMEAPQAPSTLGPGRTQGVWNTCFAHSPSGALLAAFNFWAEDTAAASGEVYRRMSVNAPNAAYATHTQLDDGGPVQFAGYKYDSYTPTTAMLDIVIQGPEGKLGSVETTMLWTNDDWRYDFPPQGKPAFEVISDLTGYVPWSSF